MFCFSFSVLFFFFGSLDIQNLAGMKFLAADLGSADGRSQRLAGEESGALSSSQASGGEQTGVKRRMNIGLRWKQTQLQWVDDDVFADVLARNKGKKREKKS